MRDIAFQKLLSSVMLDNKYDRYVKNRKTGKLDTKSLYKVNTSNKLFKRREERKNKHYAISLVVDCSGSMGGDKIKVAANSAQKLSYHLYKIGIPHNVIVFHAGVFEIKTFDAKQDKTIENRVLGEVGYGPEDSKWYSSYYFSQTETVKNINGGKPLNKFLGVASGYKEAREFEEKLDGEGVNYRQYDGAGYNTDAEALKIARETLLKQTGKKVMIFLSDGRPAPLSSYNESPVYAGTSQYDYNVKHEVDMTINSGIELFSIGIKSDAVNGYYPKKRCTVIRSTQELYPEIIRLIKKNLRRG